MTKNKKPKDTTDEISRDVHWRAVGSPPCVIVLYGGELGQRVALTGSETIIGRDDDVAVSIPIHTISRRHARIFVADNVYRIEDLGSTNGTFVNDAPIEGPRRLENGDLIRCGGSVVKFIAGGNVEAMYHEEIYNLAITDGLTQAANKRHLLDFLEREIARAVRHERPLSLVMFDLDHFKKINDTYGHLAGDRMLVGIAQYVASSVRREELFARYGGEEFAVVLPEADLDEAAGFCERIRLLIDSAIFEFDQHQMRATISLGATTLRKGDTVQSLVERADTQLYQAKRSGRNRVSVS